MSEDRLNLVVETENSETASLQGENGPQGEEEESVNEAPSEGDANVGIAPEDADTMPEKDDNSCRDSGASSGSSTPSVTTYDVDGIDLEGITVEDTGQGQAAMQEEHSFSNHETQDKDAAEKLKLPTADAEADVQIRDIVLEMDTFNRSSTRRDSFMRAMQNEETAATGDGAVMDNDMDKDMDGDGGAGGASGGVSADGAGKAKTDDDEAVVDDIQPQPYTVPGSSQGFQIMEIFTDDDWDTVKEKWRRRMQWSTRGKLLFCVFAVGVIAAVLTAVLIPVSLVFVEYHEIALARSKLTGRVDRSQTIYPGCHLLFPDTELLRFRATGHTLRVDAHISSSEGLAFRLQLALQYFIKPEELGELHRKYGEKYEGVIQSVIGSEVRNKAVFLSLRQYRLDRAYVHQYLQHHLAARLQGNCCPLCCPRHCAVSRQYEGHNCSTCSQKPDCDSGFHVSLLPQHFQVLTLQLPDNITERYLRLTMLQVETEKELFVQEYKVEQKRTEKLVKDIHNKGREVLEAARAEAKQVGLEAASEAEKTRQQAYSQAMGRLFRALNVTSIQRQLSLMNTLALRDFSENFSLQQYDHLTVV